MTDAQATEHPPTPSPAPPATTADDLAAVRDLALRAHPDAVPELVAGATIADLVASLEPARAAYRRIADAVGRPPSAAPTVPAGAAPPLVADPETLPAAEKIRRALASRER